MGSERAQQNVISLEPTILEQERTVSQTSTAAGEIGELVVEGGIWALTGGSGTANETVESVIAEVTSEAIASETFVSEAIVSEAISGAVAEAAYTTAAEVVCEAVAEGAGSTIVEVIGEVVGSIIGGIFDGL